MWPPVGWQWWGGDGVHYCIGACSQGHKFIRKFKTFKAQNAWKDDDAYQEAYIQFVKLEDSERRSGRKAGALWAENKSSEGFKIPVTTWGTCMPDALFAAMKVLQRQTALTLSLSPNPNLTMKVLRTDHPIKVDSVRRWCRKELEQEASWKDLSLALLLHQQPFELKEVSSKSLLLSLGNPNSSLSPTS